MIFKLSRDEVKTYEFTVQYRHRENLFIESKGRNQFEALHAAEAIYKKDEGYLAVIPEDPNKL